MSSIRVKNKATKEKFWIEGEGLPHPGLFEAQKRGWQGKIKIEAYIKPDGFPCHIVVAEWNWDCKLTLDENLKKDEKKERAGE